MIRKCKSPIISSTPASSRATSICSLRRAGSPPGSTIATGRPSRRGSASPQVNAHCSVRPSAIRSGH